MNYTNAQWTKKEYIEFKKYIYSLKDLKYKEFNDKIIKTKYETIGIKVPTLKKISKECSKSKYNNLIKHLQKEKTYELIILEGLLLTNIEDINKLSYELKKYLKKVDTWSFTDTLVSNLKRFKTNKKDLVYLISELLKEQDIFNRRMAYVLIINYLVEEEYLNYIYDIINNETHEEYYIEMAIAWLICECYAKYPAQTLDFLKTTSLNMDIKKKTVSKIRDSFKITNELKQKANDIIR